MRLHAYACARRAMQVQWPARAVNQQLPIAIKNNGIKIKPPQNNEPIKEQSRTPSSLVMSAARGNQNERQSERDIDRFNDSDVYAMQVKLYVNNTRHSVQSILCKKKNKKWNTFYFLQGICVDWFYRHIHDNIDNILRRLIEFYWIFFFVLSDKFDSRILLQKICQLNKNVFFVVYVPKYVKNVDVFLMFFLLSVPLKFVGVKAEEKNVFNYVWKQNTNNLFLFDKFIK